MKIKQIKYFTRPWREYVQQKYQTISRIINNIKKLFFCVYIKMNLISAEGYKKANVNFLRIKKELWVRIKDAGDRLGVKNISDLVLKEIYGIYKKKKKKKLRITK